MIASWERATTIHHHRCSEIMTLAFLIKILSRQGERAYSSDLPKIEQPFAHRVTSHGHLRSDLGDPSC